MPEKGKSSAKGRIVQAALEEAGLDNPVDVVTLIGALSALMTALGAYSDIKKLWEKRGKH